MFPEKHYSGTLSQYSCRSCEIRNGKNNKQRSKGAPHAEEFSSMLVESEMKRKAKALDDWENLIEKAGLSKLTAREIDRKVEKTIRKPS